MLKLEEVRKNYHHEKGLIRINLTIFPGNLYLFVGENGSGKSTTMKLISQVIFHTSQDGKIQNDFHRMIYLPDKRSYPKLLTVETYLKYYLNFAYQKNRINEWMKKYHLPNKKIGNLSKGMLQKLGILQTILSEGDLYLLDEPTDGLDALSIQIVKEDLKEMLINGKTIIISTHNKTIFKELKPIIYHFKEGVCNEKKQRFPSTN